jgi:hypothetical protein
MDIVNFFEKLAGRWFSQRTTHGLSTQQSKAGKSDLEVSFLAPDTAEVQQLCQAHGETNPLCGLQIQQSSTIEGDSASPKISTTLLVPLTPIAASFQGTLLRSESGNGAPHKSTYTLEDEVLTIISDDAEGRAEERLWFINDNLRMRTGLVELASGLRIASFCSEIRLGVKPPPAS